MVYVQALAAVGGLFLAKYAFNVASFIWIYFLRPSTSLKKYGAGTGAWAVVTGASDGIGKAFAQQLAKKKFNVVVISRTESKLQELVKDLETSYGVSTKVIAADFASKDPAIYDRIFSALEGLKISVLVNNVGVNFEYPEYFDAIPAQDTANIIQVNAFALTEMTRRLIPILAENKKSLIVNLGSISGTTLRAPMLAPYAATKAYVEVFSEAIAVELKKKGIDVAHVNPAFVATAMARMRKTNVSIASPTEIAAGTLGRVGVAVSYQPYWFHALMQSGMRLVPRSILNSQVFAVQQGLKKAALKRKARLAGAAPSEPKKVA